MTFEINGGDATSFVVTGGSGTLTGNVFTSDEIGSGGVYNFDVDDANGCGPVNVTGTFNCGCSTFAGTMDLTPLSICEDDDVTAMHNGDEVLDGNDALEFVLHTGNGTSLGIVVSNNSTPTFTFQAGICLLYTSPSPRDATLSRMPSSA